MAEDCPLHAYSELSARNMLARARKRGDANKVMFHCPWSDHWHVVDHSELYGEA